MLCFIVTFTAYINFILLFVLFEITLNKTELEFDADKDAAKAYVKISSTYKWKAEPTVDWLYVSIPEGEADQEYKVIISADTNPDFEVREGMVNIISGKWIKQIKVTQGKAAKILKPEDVPNYDKLYIPDIYSSYGYLKSDKPWYFGRSRQSDFSNRVRMSPQHMPFLRNVQNCPLSSPVKRRNRG